jgi:carboxypeptidase Taq
MSPTPYETLIADLKEANAISSILSLLGWDQQVNLPPKSHDRRGEQMAALSKIYFNAATNPRIGESLVALEAKGDSATDDEKVVRMHVRKDYDRLTKLSAEFVAEKARLDTEAFQVWTQAKPANDFAMFAPYLQRQIDMSKREAEMLGEPDAYDYFIDKHDPGMTAARIDALFGELKRDLVPLVRKIVDSPVKADQSRFKGFPAESQRVFAREISAAVGFNFERGRLDTAVHPFCSGDAKDTRMTTKFKEDHPLSSVFSSLHESGHALYEQGLPMDMLGTPLGEAVGMGMHESQSRLWENQVGRGRALWKRFEARFREVFSPRLDGVSSEALYLAINGVSLTPIRVDSDEVTYNLHIILRFEIEKGLFAGTLKVADLPAVWRAKAKEMLGLELKNDAEGVLQDVHWSGGAFGYFPSYCIGNMIASQLWYAVLKAIPDLEKDFERGDFSRLLGWLRTNVHAHGRRYETEELVKRVTGEGISPKHLIRYLNERYVPLYCS